MDDSSESELVRWEAMLQSKRHSHLEAEQYVQAAERQLKSAEREEQAEAAKALRAEERYRELLEELRRVRRRPERARQPRSSLGITAEAAEMEPSQLAFAEKRELYSPDKSPSKRPVPPIGGWERVTSPEPAPHAQLLIGQSRDSDSTSNSASAEPEAQACARELEAAEKKRTWFEWRSMSWKTRLVR
jgi:hypothetical protein